MPASITGAGVGLAVGAVALEVGAAELDVGEAVVAVGCGRGVAETVGVGDAGMVRGCSVAAGFPVGWLSSGADLLLRGTGVGVGLAFGAARLW